MALPQPTPPFTAADYLRWEAEQPNKHEYVHGDTFAMGATSRRHMTISGNVFAAMDTALEGTPCRTYMADMKLQAAADDAYFYPDVLVTCDPDDHKADQFMRWPTLVVEVLSPATAAYDRGDKFAAYRRIASLKEFVLIDPDQRRIEHYRRTQADRWELEEIVPEQPLHLPSLEVSLPWTRVFRNVD
ncbi:MAG: Uma2 family endonuclease [Proteobacteria bacterium]|nr:Uma2 family endonuclease [Pseudomonadota bacterium]MBS0554802.1 Uma2 family endonuclease [Pseudomonadota bacterium]